MRKMMKFRQASQTGRVQIRASMGRGAWWWPPMATYLLQMAETTPIRVISPQGAVRTLCGNGQAGFVDAQGADARFNEPCSLALDAEENLLVADSCNNAIRLER